MVRNLARLCRLELSDEEVVRAAEQIARLLEHFELLQDAVSDDTEPSSFPRPIPHRARPDQPGPVLAREDVLASAPATRAGQFLVPKVVDR